MKSRSGVRSDSRLLEAKRQRSEYQESFYEKLVRRIGPRSLLVWCGFYVAATLILLWGSESMQWRLNQGIDRDITSRVDFEVDDEDATNRDRQIARATAPDVYVANAAPLETIRGKLTELLALAKSSADDEAKFKASAAAKGWDLDREALQALRAYTSDEKSKEFDGLVRRLITRLGEQVIVEKSSNPVRLPTNAVLMGDGDRVLREIPTSQLQYLTADNRKYIEQTATSVASIFTEPLRPPVMQLIVQILLGPTAAKEPVYAQLWRYDENATRQAINRAEEKVQTSKIVYKTGNPIVRADKVSVLSNTQLDLLKREHEEFLRAEAKNPGLRQRKLLTQLGMAIMVLIVTVGFATYAASYENRSYRKPGRALGFAALMLVVILLSRITESAQYPWDLPVEFSVAFVVTAAALLTMAYEQRFALGVSAGLAILVTLACRADLGLFLTLVTAMGVTILLLREVRTRSKIILVGVLSAGTALIASIASGLIIGQDLKYVTVHGIAAGAAALAAGFIVQGILPNFERLFGVATSMTLLEWSDASRPLLRLLAQEAPGTYSHSLILSQMAEEAAVAIGARGLLARVGAMYHDIGKIQKPDYFVENQEAAMSRHDRLSPTMSLLIIVGHVKDGVEMARAYGLPRILHRFIAEHHGTTVVRCFHHAASEAAARNRGRHGREVSESEFRYPGPKPRSKETAILMLCDGCEGAVRSLGEPTPGRIESTVHQVVMDRLNDGQFDDCNITLRELKLVEQSVVKSLGAIHHGRIKYPKSAAEHPHPAAEAKPAAREPEAKPAAAAPGRTAEVAHRA